VDDSSAEPLDELLVFVDGASKGNPGESAAAFVVCDGDGNVLFENGLPDRDCNEQRGRILGITSGP